MSSSTSAPEQSGENISKKAAKKEAAKLEKLRRKQEQEEAARKTSSLSLEDESFSGNYGDVTLTELQSTEDPSAGKWREAVEGKKWTDLSHLVEETVGSEVLIRGRVNTNRPVSNKKGFLVLRQSGFTVQCVATQSEETKVGVNFIKYLKQLSNESFVDVMGVVVLPKEEVKGTTQQVEIQVRKVYCVNSALPKLPLLVEDASRSEKEMEAGLSGANQDTRLNNRVIDLRTPANQAIFRIQGQVQKAFREFLDSKDFVEIHTPKLMAGTSEGGSAVFRLDYKGQPACLAQSPQLHKQMAICGDMRRVFEVGPVFRAEDSFTHRHLCEFVGLDVEMEIRTHYSEIMDLVGDLFPFIFTKIEERCPKEVESVRKQYPFQSLKFLPQTLRLTFAQGIQMLKEAGEEVDPLGDLNTESERKLGQLVLEKYKTEFYMLHRYPSAVRPFYTMPCEDDSNYSNSFDVFIRGEEIMSGAQRIHDPQLLEKRARECGIDVKTISTYIDAFRYGVPPHGGFGVGLERVVMLLCALNNIRKTSLFPRDPQRLAP
uniref:aspartate--tRNA ligase n=1 Tax=Noccaea caerulescens TaxID=107243 RepID=A0A1J3EQZ6_NOCCA